jgi:hypothetical protein
MLLEGVDGLARGGRDDWSCSNGWAGRITRPRAAAEAPIAKARFEFACHRWWPCSTITAPRFKLQCWSSILTLRQVTASSLFDEI